jgi:NitT/TauT family transport system ATP-binding protein
MQQPVSLARALVFQPPILLMDEPFAALDEITREVMQDESLRLWARIDTTVVFITHSIPEVLSGFILAVGISYSRAVREPTYPFLVIAQVLPKMAFAPLFLIWFGFARCGSSASPFR